MTYGGSAALKTMENLPSYPLDDSATNARLNYDKASSLFGARHRLFAALLAPDFFVFGIPHRPIAFFNADYSHPQAGKRYS